jgi:hypothetical protein
MNKQRAKCPQCGRILAVQVPRGGDGSVDVFPRHDTYPGLNGNRCLMGRSPVEKSDYVREVPR